MTSETDDGFFQSTAGRIAVGTGAFNIFGMGLVALAGPGDHALPLLAVIILACIISGLFAVGLSVLREDGEPTLMMLISFPFLAGLSLAGMYGAVTAGALVGAVLLVIGLLLFALAMGAPKLAPHAVAHRTPAVSAHSA